MAPGLIQKQVRQQGLVAWLVPVVFEIRYAVGPKHVLIDQD